MVRWLPLLVVVARLADEVMLLDFGCALAAAPCRLGHVGLPLVRRGRTLRHHLEVPSPWSNPSPCHESAESPLLLGLATRMGLIEFVAEPLAS
eukprot:7637205-Pyramimonas_sp.AAC.2